MTGSTAYARRTVAIAVVLAVASVMLLLSMGDHRVAAQTPPAGRVFGTIHNGTDGATTPDTVEVRLITLSGNNVVDSRATSAVAGRFEFAVDASAELTHVLRAVYENVPYFAEPVSLSPERLTAEREIVVFEATKETPPLAISETTVTAVALDRAAGELTLLREDTVRNPVDRAYVGSDDGITFRVPAFDGVLEAGGLLDDDSVRYEAGVVTTTSPLLPGETSIVTRYVVQYDRATDRYRLRATAPIPADRMEVRIPARFVLSVDPVDATRRDGETTLQGERVLVLARSDAGPGDSLLVDLIGLSGVERAENPLTEQPGAAIAAGVALAVLAGGAVALARWRARPGGTPS